ncbi:MAG: hypothetical protein EBE86_007715 [Hormoscilla sp. GUM202]|nr:hypothetical protein [Hormoscilla sp. GUM202]
MTQRSQICENLPEQVEKILGLLHQEPSLRSQDVSAVQGSLKKAIAPKFESVFAGAFSIISATVKSIILKNCIINRKVLGAVARMFFFAIISWKRFLALREIVC